MADGPIDINKNTKSAEKNEAIKEALQLMFSRVSDHQVKIHMRVEDLLKDVHDLNTEVNDLIANLYERFPELEPDFEEEEEEI